MIIYKVFEHSKCKKIIELQYNETEKVYIGFCNTCNIEVKTKAIGDEGKIKKQYGRG